MSPLPRLMVFTALVLLGVSGSASAQGVCNEDSIKTAETCFGKLLDTAEQDLQTRYQTAQAAVKGQSQFAAMLGKSQDAFIAYRSQTCDDLVKTYWQEGTLQNVAVLSCKLALTKERTSDLDNMFQGLWGVRQ